MSDFGMIFDREHVDRIHHAIHEQALSHGAGVMMRAKGDMFQPAPSGVLGEETVANWAEATASLRERVPVPAVERLGDLLDIVIRASLEVDEGRAATFQVLLAPISDVRLPGKLTLVMAEPGQLTPGTLASLAPCVDPTRGAIVVDPSDLKVWALAQLSPQAEGEQSDWIAMTIRVTAPGSFSVRANAIEVARVSRGRIAYVLETAGSFTVANRIRTALGLSLPGGLQTAGCLLGIAKAAVSFGHGGTLLVVNAHAKPLGLERCDHTLDSHSGALLRRMYDDPLAQDVIEVTEPVPTTAFLAEIAGEPRRQHRRDFAAAKEQVARLTQADGAVLIDSQLVVRGFGCFVTVDRDKRPDTVLLLDALTGSEPRELPAAELGHARHEAALAFVSQNKGSIALVVSQDGIITLVLAADGGTVAAIRPVL